MSVFLRDYLTVVWFGIAALVLGGLLLGLAALVRPSKPNYDKGVAYECGVDPVGIGWSQSQIRYYVFALLFVIFDVEAVFLFPWAANVERYGAFGLARHARLHRAAARRPGVRMEARTAPMGLVDNGPHAGLAHEAVQHEPLVLDVGVPVGSRLLRHRDGRGVRVAPLRRHAPRRHPAAGQPAPGRLRVHLGHRDRQDGARRSCASTSRCPSRST